MPSGNRCDGPQCDYFGAPSSSWLYLVQHTDSESFAAMLGIARTEPLTFCSPLCVADYCYSRAVITGPATGEEPQPQAQPIEFEPVPDEPEIEFTGTGWPR